MKLEFAGTLPFSTGSAKTPEDREARIASLIPPAFLPAKNTSAKANALIIMRRRLAGYEWRMYEIPSIDWLLYVSAVEENTVANREGYDLTVVTMGTRLLSGHVYSYPIEQPYNSLFIKAHLGAKRAWRSWLEKQAARAHVY